MKKILLFTICFISLYLANFAFSATDNFCSSYPPAWYDNFMFSINPTFEDLNTYISQCAISNKSYLNIKISGERSVYLPYGTQKITFAIKNHTAVATYLIKINGIPSGSDVDVSTAPTECVSQICPYTSPITDLYGDQILIQQVQQYCPSFAYPNLICSHPNTLWEGKTFNAVQNTTILTVPSTFWNNHPNGAWMVFSWEGGTGGNALQLEIDKDKFDTWYSNFANKNSIINCPIDENNNSSNDNNNNNTNQNSTNENNEPNENATQDLNENATITITEPKVTINNNGTIQIDFQCNATATNNVNYKWDLNGDNIYEKTTQECFISQIYSPQNISKGIVVKVALEDSSNHIIDSDFLYLFAFKGRLLKGGFPFSSTTPIVWINDNFIGKILLWIYSK
jgi:hypothetical protein